MLGCAKIFVLHSICIVPKLLVIPDLAYTARNNLFLWSNLDFKNQLKCVNDINFLHMNLNYKKPKYALLSLLYLFPT